MSKSKTNNKEMAKGKRREENDLRVKAFGKLSKEEKILLLDSRLGKGMGAAKQRKKLSEK